MRCGGVDNCLVECNDGADIALVQFSLDGRLATEGKLFQMVRKLVEIGVKPYAEHAALCLYAGIKLVCSHFYR